MTTAVRDYLQSVVSTIEKRHSRRGSTTGKRQWELNLLTGAKLLLAQEQLDLPLAEKPAPRRNSILRGTGTEFPTETPTPAPLPEGASDLVLRTSPEAAQ